MLPLHYESFEAVFPPEHRERVVQDIVGEVRNLAFHSRFWKYVKEGDQACHDKKYAEAQFAYEQALLKLPKNPSFDQSKTPGDLEFELRCRRGGMFKVQRRFPEAIKEYERALQLEPQNASIYEHLGDISFEQKDIDKALKWYNHALDLKGPGDQLHKKIADCHFKKEAYQEAIKFYQLVRSDAPGDNTISKSLGDCYFHLKSYRNALGAYREALNLVPDCVYCRQQIDRCLDYLLTSPFPKLKLRFLIIGIVCGTGPVNLETQLVSSFNQFTVPLSFKLSRSEIG